MLVYILYLKITDQNCKPQTSPNIRRYHYHYNVSVIVIFIIILLPDVPIIEVELLTLHVRLLSFPSIPFILTVTLFLKYRF